jgi:hypothetical protein
MINNKKSIYIVGILVLLMALTVLSCSGASGIPNLFATETPTPTNTFIPSPTLTPGPTLTATQTPSATPTPVPTGINVEKQSDGTTLFVDYDNKFKLTLPEDWVVIPFKKDSLTETLNRLAEENPQLAAAAKAFENMDPEMFRLVAINKNLKYLKNTFASNLNVTAYENDLLATMPLEFVAGALEQQFENQGAKVLTHDVNVVENSHGVAMQYIEIEQTIAGNKIRQRVLMFQANKKLIMLTFTTLPEFSKELFEEGNQIGGTVELLK